MLNAQYKDIDKRKIEIDDRELSARLGRVCSHKDDDLFRVCDTLMQIIDARYAFARVKLNICKDGTVDFGFYKAHSIALEKNLKGCDEAFVFAVTLGAEVDRMIAKLAKTSRAEAFIFDAVASAIAESVANVAESEITEGLSCCARFSPGYSDFSLDCQRPMLDYLGAGIYLGVCVGESNLMTPQKTVSAIMGIKSKLNESVTI